MRNVVTGAEVPCKVVDSSPGANGLAEVGVEFAQPNTRFWRVSFPSVDWSTRSPEAKRFVSSPSAAPPPTDSVAKKELCQSVNPQPSLAVPTCPTRRIFPLGEMRPSLVILGGGNHEGKTDVDVYWSNPGGGSSARRQQCESARRRQIAGRRDAGAGLYVEFAGGEAR